MVTSTLKNINTILITGGGLLGISFLGALKYLLDEHVIDMNNITTYVGISIGAFILFIININYTVDELYEFVLKFDISLLKNDMCIDNLISHYGFDFGYNLITVCKLLLYNKFNVYDISFSTLYNLTHKKLIISTTNLSTYDNELFSVDNHPNTSVILALRMSMSVPIIYTPIYYNNSYYSDGFLSSLDNYYYKSNCVKLVIMPSYDNTNKSIYCYITNIILTIIKSINKYNTNHNIIYDIDTNTLNIHIKFKHVVSLFNFNLSTQDKQMIFNIGYNTTKKTIKYITRFF